MLNEEKVVSELQQEVKVKVDIITSDDIKIHYTGKFQDFTARYIINIASKLQEYQIAKFDLFSLRNNYQLCNYPFPKQSQVFTVVQKKAFGNIMGNGENAGNQHFLLSLQCSFGYLRQKSSFNPLQLNPDF